MEVGLSYNFEVRNHPIYHLINAKVQKEQGQVKEAIETLNTAMDLVSKSSKDSNKDFSTSDRLSLYLELSDCHRMEGNNQEAARVMQEAMTAYQGWVN